MSDFLDSADPGYITFFVIITSIPLFTTCVRLFIRWQQFKKLQADDIFNALALLALIGYTAASLIYNHSQDPNVFLQAFIASEMLIWMTFWMVKASFLALLWTIFGVSPGFRKFWWAVAVYTFIFFWPVLFSILWQCGSPSAYTNLQSCASFQDSGDYQIIIWMHFILHLSSEVFILLLPVFRIRKLHMSFRKKISAGAFFAFIAIDIIFGILRNVAAIYEFASGSQGGNDILAAFTTIAYDIDAICSVVEPALAVLVCSLPPYRALIFKRQQRKKLQQQRDAAKAGRLWQRPRRIFKQLSARIPSPYLSISIMREEPTQTTQQHEEPPLVEVPEMLGVACEAENSGSEEIQERKTAGDGAPLDH